MTTLRIAVQKNGRLSEKSIELFKECGIGINTSVGNKLTAKAKNFPIELLFLRDDDIPGYVADGIADAGVVGQNVVEEKSPGLKICEKLGFASCRLSIAVPKSFGYKTIEDLSGKRIATSYPNILKRFLESKNISSSIQEISGSVEIAPGIGLADAICDLVSSGGTLQANRLIEVEKVIDSEAVLVESPTLDAEKKAIIEELSFRIQTVRKSKGCKYIVLNSPSEALEKVCGLLPGIKSPTIVELAEPGWSAVHAVVQEDAFWEVLSNLRAAGAEGITVLPIEKMIA